MRTRNTPGGKGGRCVRLTTYHHTVPLSRNLGALTSLDPSGAAWPVTGVLYLLVLTLLNCCLDKIMLLPFILMLAVLNIYIAWSWLLPWHCWWVVLDSCQCFPSLSQLLIFKSNSICENYLILEIIFQQLIAVHTNIHLINFILCRGRCALYCDQWTLEWNMAYDCESLNYFYIRRNCSVFHYNWKEWDT